MLTSNRLPIPYANLTRYSPHAQPPPSTKTVKTAYRILLPNNIITADSQTFNRNQPAPIGNKSPITGIHDNNNAQTPYFSNRRLALSEMRWRLGSQ